MIPLLDVRNLSVSFPTRRGPVRAVEGVTFTVGRGETVALVGESGSGKSTVALALTGLLPRGARPQVAGEVMLAGQDLLRLPSSALRKVRGGSVGMIFQDPSTALNPILTIGQQVAEPLQIHLGLSWSKAQERAAELLALVRVSAPEQRLRQYPHNLSGGMRQRVMIAIALSCRPGLLIADEPTTALDVTVQAQVLRLIGEMKAAIGMSVLLITHDLGVVWETADRVVVMYAGRKVEDGAVGTVLSGPAHPYTAGLLRAAEKAGEGGRLAEIPGTVPSPYARPPGCAFEPRCARAVPRCREAVPPLVPLPPDGAAACILAQTVPAA
jgi:oligopeptide/dipeptide ABC transporter ATP-binding protein